MKILNLYIASLAVVLAASSCNSKNNPTIQPIVDSEDDKPKAAEVGKTIPAWTEGQLDIHFINTTTGECTFIILPDGTQILVDAAGSDTATGPVGSTTNTGIRSRWDPTKDSKFDCGQFIENYIRRCMEWSGNSKIDYVLDTHLHNDHYGSHLSKAVSSNSGTYRRQTLVAILEDIPVGKLLDRGYPDYNYPFDMMKYYSASSESSVYNYITAVRWLVANKGLKAEKFVAGSDSQMTLTHNSASYPDCKIRNLSVNGDVWTGSGSNFTSTFPALKDIVCSNPPGVENSDKCGEENHESCTFKLSYGKFDYFAGADLQYDGLSSFSWKDIETPVAKACGQVEVMKADHHGTSNTNGYGYKDTAWAMNYLNPQCWIVNSWTDGHPRQATFEGVTSLLPNMDIFITNTCTAQKAYANYNRVKSADGHIVVRVEKGGTYYFVYTLTDSDGKMTVKNAAGPYGSR